VLLNKEADGNLSHSTLNKRLFVHSNKVIHQDDSKRFSQQPLPFLHSLLD